jgi:hypothetical protein
MWALPKPLLKAFAVQELGNYHAQVALDVCA